MNALWMLYAVAVAAVLSVGAFAAERALRAAGRPGRGAWAAAMAGSWALPLMALFGWAGSGGAETAATPTFNATEITVTEVAAAGQGAAASGPGWETVVDASREALVSPAAARVATVGWIVLAALALLVVGVAVARLLRRSRRWPTAAVLDEPVRLSPDFGPAVLGVFRPRIVLPRWILSLGEAPLRLILEHEREHRSARDTLLLTGATVATLAAPWNLPLWWQLRRLRMAVELDCDRRVLGRGAPVREYGELLMTVGGRISHLAVPAAALSEESSFLERRLKAMTQRRTNGWRWRAAAGLAVAGAMVFVACETPAPTNLNGPAPTEGETAAAVEGEEVKAAEIRAEETESPTRTIRGSRQALQIRGMVVAAERTNSVALGTPVVEDGELVGIRVRGEETLSAADGDPLLYLDGVRLTGSLPSFEIDPEEIVRIEVIKGPAAETLYGAEAAGGVIQIFTKDQVAQNEPERAERRTIRERPSTVSPRGGAGAENRPLIYVDGVRMSDADVSGGDAAERVLDTIDPEDIDRIEIIKGAAASEIYGADARAGVIQIYTKDGGGAREPEPDADGEFRVREIREREPVSEGGATFEFEARPLTARFTPDTIRATGVIRERR